MEEQKTTHTAYNLAIDFANNGNVEGLQNLATLNNVTWGYAILVNGILKNRYKVVNYCLNELEYNKEELNKAINLSQITTASYMDVIKNWYPNYYGYEEGGKATTNRINRIANSINCCKNTDNSQCRPVFRMLESPKFDRETVLIQCLKIGSGRVIECLVEKYGTTVFDDLIRCPYLITNQTYILTSLIENKVPIREGSFETLIENNSRINVKQLAKWEFTIRSPAIGPMGNTILHTCDDLKILKVVIELGLVDINSRNKWGLTPLLHRIKEKKVFNLSYFMDHGADLTIPDNTGNTVLHLCDDPDLLKTLSKYVPINMINARNYAGMTPVLFQISFDHISMVQVLIDMGANLSDVDNNGNTVFHYCKSDSMVIILVEYDADPTNYNNLGESTIKKIVASGCQSELAIQLLLAYEVDPRERCGPDDKSAYDLLTDENKLLIDTVISGFVNADITEDTKDGLEPVAMEKTKEELESEPVVAMEEVEEFDPSQVFGELNNTQGYVKSPILSGFADAN